MSTKTNFVRYTIFFVLALLLAACADPSAPTLPETVAVPVETPVPSTGEESPQEVPDLLPIPVEHVQVEFGEGSPIPVDAVASGSWPNLCAQVAQINQRLVGTRFEIEVLATPADADCPPDHVGLPFRIAIPLNVVELPAGTYAVSVNGVETGFAWDFMDTSGVVSGDALAGDLEPLPVQAVTVDVGIGSPIPVEVIASGSWPELCSQLAEVTQKISGTRIEISLLATPANSECPPDNVGVPFRVAIPLNGVQLAPGSYTVVVNGIETDFEWTGKAPEGSSSTGSLLVAYIGSDGNLWVLDAEPGEPRQLTADATPIDANATSVMVYNFPRLSSDGTLLAVRRDVGTAVEGGLQYEFELLVLDTRSGEAVLVLKSEVPHAGFDWKPGTHRLAYGLGTDPNYFMIRGGKPDSALAFGIFEVDADSGETSELVKPERGYTLMTPVWSPDGRFLSFDEVLYMEGRGQFGYYDFENQEYIAWDESLGFYDWSPDGSQIVYDRMVYVPTGEERIYVRGRLESAEQQLSPASMAGYTFFPVLSPDGTQMALMANPGGPDSMDYTLYVQAFPEGEPLQLGVFESVWYIDWAPDGSRLVFSAGPYEDRQVIALDATDGTSTVLAQGDQPTVAAMP